MRVSKKLTTFQAFWAGERPRRDAPLGAQGGGHARAGTGSRRHACAQRRARACHVCGRGSKGPLRGGPPRARTGPAGGLSAGRAWTGWGRGQGGAPAWGAFRLRTGGGSRRCSPKSLRVSVGVATAPRASAARGRRRGSERALGGSLRAAAEHRPARRGRRSGSGPEVFGASAGVET